MREWQKYVICLLALTAVQAGLFWPVLTGRVTLMPTDMLHQLVLPYGESVAHVAVQNHYTMDVIEQDYPWALLWQQSVRAGQVPLWNPYVMGGEPHLDTSMAAVFNPLKVLLLFLSVERAISLGIVLAFVVAGWSMFAFLRELGRSHTAAFVGGVAWSLNSAFLMWYWRLPATLAVVPLALLLFERGQQRGSWPCSLGAGLILGISFLSGNVQSAMHIGFLATGYFLVCLAASDAAARRRIWRHALLVLVVGWMMAAVQWLPSLELLCHVLSGRLQAGPRASIRHTVVGFAALITFVWPGLAGSTESYDLLKLIPAGMGDFTGSIGVVSFTFAVIGAIGAREKRVRGLLIVAAVAVGLVLLTPLVKYVYHRLLIVVVFAEAVSCAYGVDLVLETPRERTQLIHRVFGWMGVCAVSVAAGLLAVQAVVHVKRGWLVTAGQRYVMQHTEGGFFSTNQQWLLGRVPLFLDHYRLSNIVFWLPMVLLGCITAVWIGFASRRVSRFWFCVVLVGASVCELAVSGRMIVPQVNLLAYPLYPPLKVLSLLREDKELFRVHRFAPNEPLFLPDNLLMVYGLSSLTGYESMAPENLSSLRSSQPDAPATLLDLQNVKYILAPDALALPANRFEFVMQSDHIWLYRNRNVLPRVQFVPSWEVVTNRNDIYARITSGAFDPRQVVLLEQEPPTVARGRSAPIGSSGTATVQVERYAPQQIIVRVNAAAPGVLVLADTFYPGWKARVDNHPTRLLRADFVLKAVAVPAGEHAVEFFYAPRSFWIGAALCVLTIIGALLFGAVSVWRRHQTLSAGASPGC